MRKVNLIKAIVAMLCCSCYFWSCGEDDLKDEQNAQLRPGQLTVEDAQALFKNCAVEMSASRSDLPSMCLSTFDPGIVTPNWDNAELSLSGDYSFVNVPIQTTVLYVAHSLSDKKEVDVMQKLVAVQNDATHQTGIYIMNIIPEGQFVDWSTEAVEEQCNAGNLPADFSGIILFTQLQGGSPVYAASYENGQIIDSESLNDAEMNSEIDSRKTLRLLQGYMVSGLDMFASRSLPEDGDDPFIPDLDDDGYVVGNSDIITNPDGYSFSISLTIRNGKVRITFSGGYVEVDGQRVIYGKDENGNNYKGVDIDGDGNVDVVYPLY